MPYGDGTGPFGSFRNWVPVNGEGKPGLGRRAFHGRHFYNRPFGMGRGNRFRYYATGVPGWMAFEHLYMQGGQKPSKEEAKNEEINALEQELEAIKKRLTELKKE